jgi:hypothetical protein
MSWRSTPIRDLAPAIAAVTLVVLGLCAQPARAQSLESAIMPGAVTQAHIKQESDCKNCHVRFERSAQPRLCLDCHKEVAADVRAKAGFHGRLKERECRTCHTEHKGRDARIVKLDETTFDHTQTDFALRGKHKGVNCSNCHRPKTKHSAAPSTCVGCHRKDDKHKDTLGSKCENCHSESAWKETRFDHAKTRFPLLLHHASVKCVECHADPQHLANTPRECVACHRKDDAHKAVLGEKCEKCHSEKTWKEAVRFDHGRDSRFPLREAHRKAKCEGCHKDVRFHDKPPSACFGCHERNDLEKGHKGRYGKKCENCHVEKTFRAVIFEHARDTRYPLRGRHRQLKCDSCHTGVLYRDKLAGRCFACHERDDKHQGQLGSDCGRCHGETSWHENSFDHDRSEFPLRERHAGLDCRKCHSSPAFKDAKTDCASCHAKDDYHKQLLGPRCEQCHSPRGWKNWEFDHSLRSRFKLVGKHAKLRCIACHTKPISDKVALATECLSCHRADDIHFETNGPQCERCHMPDNWRHVINQEGNKKPK